MTVKKKLAGTSNLAVIVDFHGRLLSVYSNGDIFINEYVTIDGRLLPAKKSKCSSNKVTGYRRFATIINGVSHTALVHRLVAIAYLNDYSETLEVDHINGKRDDNRVCNLRMISHKMNSRSFVKSSRGKSNYRGVYWNRNRWQSSIVVDGKYHYLGRFKKETDAANAYNKAAINHGFNKEALNELA